MITNQKSEFSLNIDILIHNWASEKKCAPLDILNINIFILEVQEMIVQKTKKDKNTAEEVGRLQRPTSCAVWGS